MHIPDEYHNPELKVMKILEEMEYIQNEFNCSEEAAALVLIARELQEVNRNLEPIHRIYSWKTRAF